MTAVERLLAIARAEIGYREKESNAQLDAPGANAGDGNYTKYARDLHRAGYYQANKQGYDWCDMFVDWCFLQLCGSREVAEKVQCQHGPYGAGCGWSKRYYKDEGRLYHKYPESGDQCFFRDSSHTGIVERVDDTYLYTIEGNSDNRVASRRYRLDDPRIDRDFGRPLWWLVPESTGFVDVPDGAYYAEAVRWAVENGIVKGVSESRFAPDDACTRGQAMTMLWRMQGSPEPEGQYHPFVDVQPAEYCAKPVQWAVQQSITTGTDATHFSPKQACTRGQIVTFLWRLAHSPDCTSNDFDDLSADDYCLIAANWALQRGITKGIYEGHFGPTEPCTRGMIVTMLYRYGQL